MREPLPLSTIDGKLLGSHQGKKVKHGPRKRMNSSGDATDDNDSVSNTGTQHTPPSTIGTQHHPQMNRCSSGNDDDVCSVPDELESLTSREEFLHQLVSNELRQRAMTWAGAPQAISSVRRPRKSVAEQQKDVAMSRLRSELSDIKHIKSKLASTSGDFMISSTYKNPPEPPRRKAMTAVSWDHRTLFESQRGENHRRLCESHSAPLNFAQPKHKHFDSTMRNSIDNQKARSHDTRPFTAW